MSHHPELINPAKTLSFSKPKKPTFSPNPNPTDLPHSTKMADHRFTKGSKVEVSSDDEGFKGAWYVATIIEGPKFGKCLIEYETLVEDEEGSEPLTEGVLVSYIRPLQPLPADAGGCFEVNDIVDAFHRDGWWTGVVARVVEGSGKFLVTFENPPDEIEFSRSELRVHMEWVDGKWEKPQKKVCGFLSLFNFCYFLYFFDWGL